MARTVLAGERIDLRAKFYRNGALFNPYGINIVRIYDAAVGGNLIATLSIPSQESTGIYSSSWTVPRNVDAGTYFDEWVWAAESGMAYVTQRYSFSVTELPSPSTSDSISINICTHENPRWIGLAGVQDVLDIGNGMGQKPVWNLALPNDYRNTVFYNIYYSGTRYGVFESGPKAITTQREAIINVPPGKVYYFSVRATEFSANEFNIESLNQISSNTYAYPDSQLLLENIDGYGATVKVSDASGFPNFGFLLVGNEIMRYVSRTNTEFYVEDIDRGAYGTSISEHLADELVSLWHGFEDQNSNMLQGAADWKYENGSPQNIDAIGQVNVDEDGYRASNEDILTTNLIVSDENNSQFPNYDYTGYHRPSPQDTFSGKCVGSYLGGDFNGGRGFSFQERNLSQLDALLQLTAEPVILLKKKWTGQRCRCISLRREQPRERCSFCFNTGFTGGYDRFFNNRPISESFINTQGMILIRFQPYIDDLETTLDQGLRQNVELTGWTIGFPTIKDRDVMVRFTQDGIEEFRYEVLSVTRNKLLFGETGRQEIKVRRLDKTDPVYQFNTII